MRSVPRLFVVLLLCALAASTAGCDLFSAEKEKNAPPSREGPTVVAQMQGNEPALWLFDPKTLKRTAVIETEGQTPNGLAFSPNNERWYVSWDVGSTLEGNLRLVRAILDPTTGEITRRVTTSDLSVGVGPLFYEPITDHVVGYGDSLEFFDPETLELVREVPVGDSTDVVVDAVVADERGKLYFGVITEGGTGLYVYDPAEREISSTIMLSSPSDIALSPDERYLYATTWGGGIIRPGRFHMVDLKTGETVFEGGPVGKNANLAVGPDGRYVYIDSPGGGPLSQAVSSEKVYRFDVEARELEVLIHWPEGPPEVTGGFGLTADQITMLPGGEAFVMYNRAALFSYRPEEDGEPAPPLLKVDAETGEVLATYTLPRKEDGTPQATVRQLHVGVVPEE